VDSLAKILKPKSKEDLNKEIHKMSTYEFLYKFRNHNFKIKGLKVGWKKRSMYFLVFSKFFNKFARCYWILWILWFSIIILKNFIPFLQTHYINLLEHIFWYMMMTSIVVLLINFIAIRKFYRYKNKQSKGNANVLIDHIIMAMNDTDRIRIMNEAVNEAINNAINDENNTRRIINDTAIAFPIPSISSLSSREAINDAIKDNETNES